MNMKTLIVAIGFTIAIFLFYKFVMNPQIISGLPSKQCPERWSYDKPLCKPDYETVCSAFDPSKMNMGDKVSFAQQCGVQWN
jgi:hypothetical protein